MDPTKDVETSTAAITTSGIEAAKTEHQPTTISPKFHYFLELPTEIRVLIYQEIVSIDYYDNPGRLDIFKTSKQIRNEGAEASSRYCKFFVRFGWLAQPFEAPPTRKLTATRLIQDVTIAVNLRGIDWGITGDMQGPIDCKHIEYFGGSNIMRKSCRVTLWYGKNGYVSKDCASDLLFKALRKLTGFRTLLVKIISDQNRRIVSGGIIPLIPVSQWASLQQWDPWAMNFCIMSIRNSPKVDLYTERVKAALEPALGPATLTIRGGGESQELLFHPFEWKP